MSGNKKKLLIVGRDTENRQSLATALAGKGFQVEEAVDMQQAIAAVKKDHHDVVISAYELGNPAANGVTLAEALASRGDDIGFILINESGRSEAHKHPSFDKLHKEGAIDKWFDVVPEIRSLIRAIEMLERPHPRINMTDNRTVERG